MKAGAPGSMAYIGRLGRRTRSKDEINCVFYPVSCSQALPGDMLAYTHYQTQENLVPRLRLGTCQSFVFPGRAWEQVELTTVNCKL
jgi:hypothetical protein